MADDKAFRRLEEKRLFLRNEMREHNKQLVEAAQQVGVKSNPDFAIIYQFTLNKRQSLGMQV